MADRDWTEFCHHCKQPLALNEEVLDRGQDLKDKATTVTRKLAELSSLHAFLVAPKIDYPPGAQREIDDLNARISQLEQQCRISHFTVKTLYPGANRGLIRLKPDEWAEMILMLHRDHHRHCKKAKVNGEIPVNTNRLKSRQGQNQLWRFKQLILK